MDDLTILAEGSFLGGKYQIVRALESVAGDGAATRCYVARDSVEGRSWVLRQLPLPDDEAERRVFSRWFYAEGERQSAVQHRSLPRVPEFFLEKGFAWAVSEQIDGEPLPRHLEARAEPIPTDQVRKWLRSLADGLHALHEQDPTLVLGGFSPADLVVTTKGRLRFGTLGTGRLRPPVAGAGEASAAPSRRSDIQALGAVGFRILTGRDPAEEAGRELRDARPDADGELVEIVERCLGVGPEPAFETTTELCAWLSGHARETAENPPRLGVAPERLTLTHVSHDGVAVTAFSIVNRGGGILTGSVSTADSWVKVSPETFEGNDVEIQVWTDAAAFAEKDEAASVITVRTAHEVQEVPLAVMLQKSALGRLPAPSVGLIMVAVAGIPTAGLVAWKLQIARVAATTLVGANRAAASGPALHGVAQGAWHALQVELVLAWMLPLLVLLLDRQLPARLRRSVRLYYALSLVLPSVATGLAFRHAPALPGIDHASRLQALDPLYAFAWFLATNLVAAVLLLVPEHRYPGRLRTQPHLRWALGAVLLVLWCRVYWLTAFP